MSYVNPVGAIPHDVICIADYERLAADRIPEPYRSYFEAGVADEKTLAANRCRFDAYRMLPRVLADFSAADGGLTLLGRRHAAPILLAPVAHQGLVHPEAECATKRGADAAATTMCVSTLSSCTLEDVARVSPDGNWFQLYFQSRREDTLSLVRRAENAAYEALVVTVDTPVNGLRNRIQRSGFTLPEHVVEANLVHHMPARSRRLEPDQSVVLHGYMADAPGWNDLAWLRQQTRLPLLVKGILHPQDALNALQLGADGVVVSNHGGRSLDSVPATIDLVAAIRQEVGDAMLVLLDGGIRRGSDVFKALALGADAVMVGRPQVYGLALAGALGVAHMLKLLQDEFHVTMALAGCPDLAAVRGAALVADAGVVRSCC